MQYQFFLSGDCQKVNNRVFHSPGHCYMVVFLLTQTHKSDIQNAISILFIQRLPESEQQGFSFTRPLLYGCFSIYPNTIMRQSECNHIFFLFGCLYKCHNTKIGQSAYNPIYFYSQGDVIRLFLYLPKHKSRTIGMQYHIQGGPKKVP